MHTEINQSLTCSHTETIRTLKPTSCWSVCIPVLYEHWNQPVVDVFAYWDYTHTETNRLLVCLHTGTVWTLKSTSRWRVRILGQYAHWNDHIIGVFAYWESMHTEINQSLACSYTGPDYAHWNQPVVDEFSYRRRVRLGIKAPVKYLFCIERLQFLGCSRCCWNLFSRGLRGLLSWATYTCRAVHTVLLYIYM